jgi:hypothetical protein
MDEKKPPQVQPPVPYMRMSITDKIRATMQSVRIEVVIILGVLLIISCMILVIFKLVKPAEGDIGNVVINKLLDQLNTLEGALIAWGTSLLGAVAARIRVNGNKKDKEGK